MEPVVIHGYPGLLKLVDNAEYFKDLHVDVVHEGDDFDWAFGSSQFLRHKPLFTSKRGTYYYACGATVRGGFQMEVKPKSFIDSIRARAPSKNSPAWSNDMDYEQMGKKTVLKQLLKWVPKSPHLARTVALDNMAEGESSQSSVFSSLVTGDDVIDGEVVEDDAPPPIETKPAQKKKAKTTAKPKEEKQHEEEDVEVTTGTLVERKLFDDDQSAGTKDDDSQTGDDVLNFEKWSDYLEKAEGEQDLNTVEDLIREMKEQVRGAATVLLKNKRDRLEALE